MYIAPKGVAVEALSPQFLLVNDMEATLLTKHVGVQACTKEQFITLHMPRLLPTMAVGVRQRLALRLLQEVEEGSVDVGLLHEVDRECG